LQNFLIKIGTKKNIAKVLVILAKTPEATPRAIERRDRHAAARPKHGDEVPDESGMD
jgi:predicted transcriptional regulator